VNRSDAIKAGAATGIGLAALTIAIGILLSRRQFAERPEASGDVGMLAVYGQIRDTPTRLYPKRGAVLPRPQHLAFQFTAAGTGPRIVRIELVAGDHRSTMHEERIDAPKDRWSLGWVLLLDDNYPDLLEVEVVVEAPHARSVRSRIPLQLTGESDPERPFGPGAAAPQ